MKIHDIDKNTPIGDIAGAGLPELHMAKEQIQEQQERLHAALRASGTGTFRWDVLTNKLDWDANLNQLFGLPPGRRVTRLEDFIELVHPDDKHAVALACAQCNDNGVDFDMEFRIIRADGAVRWINDKGKLFFDASGKPSYMTGACVDVTKHKETESALRASTQRLQLALSAGKLGEWSWDAASDLVTLGEFAAQIFGLPPGQDITWTAMRAMLHPDDRERARLAVEHALASHLDYNIEYRILHPSKGERWIAAQGRGIYSSRPKIAGMIGVVKDVTVHKQAEQALHEQAARLRATFDHAAVGMAVAALDGRLQEVNDRFTEIVNYSPQELQQRTFFDLTHPDDLAATQAEVAKLFDGSKPYYAIEKRYLRKDGTIIWSHTTVTLLRDAAGQPQRFIGAIQDITQRKQTELALRQSELFNRTIIESSRDCTKILSLEGILLWMNEAGRHALCLESIDSILGKSWIGFWPEQNQAAAAAAVKAAADGGTGHFTGGLSTINGVSWWEVVLTPIMDLSGHPERLLAVSRDVTQRIEGEQALQDETHMLELLNRTGSLLSSQLDMQTLLQSVTDAATQLSGAKFGAFFYTREDESGEVFTLYTLSGAPREAFDKLGHPRATSLFGTTFNGEAIVRCDDVRTDPRYGKWQPHCGMPKGHLPVVSYLAVPVISRSGKPIGGLFFGHPDVGVFTERTERIIASIAAQAAIAIDNARLYEASVNLAKEREMLLESERYARAEAMRMSDLKDEFLATLSHELRTPLSAILGWSQILRRGVKTEADLHKGVDTIERNARVQIQLIDDLLDMSRIVSGKVRLNVQTLSPAAIIEAAVETLRPSAEAKNIALQTTLAPETASVSGDASRLQQVLWNLLSNAIKFTPHNGKIQITLEQDSTGIRIIVADSGIGIRPDFLPYVFDRFRQADASTTRRYGGLGLGLSIVKHLVELHGGTVSVDSAGEGMGATFTVCLPAEGADSSGLQLAGAQTALAYSGNFEILDLTNVKILVIDDEDDARELIKRLLTECDASVLTAGTPDEALSIIESERPHILLSDIGMPGMDGFELLRRIRALGPERGGKLPAIALTAFARPEDRARVMRAGFLAHVSKPVEPTELVAVVANIVQQKACT